MRSNPHKYYVLAAEQGWTTPNNPLNNPVNNPAELAQTRINTRFLAAEQGEQAEQPYLLYKSKI